MTTQKKAVREANKKRAKAIDSFADKLKREHNFYEQILWDKLRGCQMGPNFRHQEVIGDTKYVADFYCSLLRLNIEVDGGIHTTPERQAKDQRRDAALEAIGVRVLRIATKALHTKNITRTLYHIRNVIEERTLELGGTVE